MSIIKQNFEGNERRVGFELEFIGIDLPDIALSIQECFGGDIKEHHSTKFEVNTDEFGKFIVELDAQPIQKLSKAVQKGKAENKNDIVGAMEKIVTPIASSFVPNEVVTPPIPISKIGKLEKLSQKLRKNNAKGTEQSIFYAFGLHINPEAPSLEADSLLSYLQAFALSHDWLHKGISVDISRKLTPHIENFDKNYLKKILAPTYTPTITELIDDYLQDNPTRNRALDMLPLLSFIDEDRVQSVAKSNLVKKRPTFHYRMPNCEIDNVSWSITGEWERWCVVEELAQDNEKRAEMTKKYFSYSYIDNPLEIFSNEWLKISSKYLDA